LSFKLAKGVMARLSSLRAGLSWELWLLPFLIALDRISKNMVELHLPWQVHVPFLPKLLGFYYTANTGAAFSIFTGQNAILATIASVAAIFLLVVRPRLTEGKTMLRVTWCLMLAGALGNLWDRLTRGAVVDFLFFEFINFPVFNIADTCMVCGLSLYILVTMFTPVTRDIS